MKQHKRQNALQEKSI